MALPTGFDPKNMSFGPSQPVIGIPKNTTSGSSYSSSRRSSYSRSLWSRFNDAIEDFGNMIADATEGIVNVMSIIAGVAIALGALIWVIGIWIDEGFFLALLAAVAAYIIGVIGIGIAWYAVNIVMNIVLFCLRFIFWNGWSLLITILLTVGIIVGSNVYRSYDYNHFSNENTKEQVSAPVTTIYYCTAQSVLNIRSAANSNATVIGTLKPGQRIEVYNIVNGFAKFSYGGSYGYASTKYLRKAQ